MSALQLILAILFPPLSVFLQRGVSGTLVLNVILTIIGWIPGVLHALWIGYGSSSARTTAHA